MERRMVERQIRMIVRRMVERQNNNDGKNNDEKKNRMTKYEGWKEEWQKDK